MPLLSDVHPGFWFAMKDHPSLEQVIRDLSPEDFTVYSKKVLPAEHLDGFVPQMDVEITLAHKDHEHGIILGFRNLLEGTLFSSEENLKLWFTLATADCSVRAIKDLALGHMASLRLAFNDKSVDGAAAKRLSFGETVDLFQVLRHPNLVENKVVTFSAPTGAKEFVLFGEQKVTI